MTERTAIRRESMAQYLSRSVKRESSFARIKVTKDEAETVKNVIAYSHLKQCPHTHYPRRVGVPTAPR